MAGAATAALLLIVFREDRDVRPLTEAVLRRLRLDGLEWDDSPLQLPPDLEEELAQRTDELEAMGFRVVGDVRVIDRLQPVQGVHLFVRISIGPRNRVGAAVACNVIESAHPEVVGPVQLQLVSETREGGFIYAVERHAVPADPFHPTPIVYRRHPPGLPASELVRSHREAIRGVDIVEVSDLEDVVASQEREHALRRDSRWTAARDGLSRAQVVALGGPPGPVMSARVARAVRKRLRDPEPF